MRSNAHMLACIIAVFVVVYIPHSCGYFFNDYVYAQQWPTAFCTPGNSKISVDACLFARNITTWTNHGLWPSVNETYPNYCNDTWKLSEMDISSLLDDMRARWPSYNNGSTSFKFWEHEWDKHGTCAANVSDLYGPYKYFSFVLELNVKYNILELLAKSSQKIVPVKDRCYNYTEFEAATKEVFNESVILGCTWDSETKQHHIAQIEICFDKEFGLNCAPNWSQKRSYQNKHHSVKDMPYVTPCSPKEQICYYPIPHLN